MATDEEKALIRRANQLFPMTDYTDPATVRYMRRCWLRQVAYLRSDACKATWLHDLPILQRKKAA